MKSKVNATDMSQLNSHEGFDLGFEMDDDGVAPYINSIGELNRGEVEIDTLEDLLFFISRYGRIILNKDSIEIYNWYRE